MPKWGLPKGCGALVKAFERTGREYPWLLTTCSKHIYWTSVDATVRHIGDFFNFKVAQL
jgi:hypothetical protein